jgi:hypothetical protein
MAITQISRDTLTEVVDIVRVISTDDLAAVAASGYLTAQIPNLEAINNGVWNWLPQDVVLVSASDGAQLFTLSSDQTTLVAFPVGNGNVALPVVSGDFTVFDGTTGSLSDAGYSPSNAAKTKVVMANGASIVSHIATYIDTTGTIAEDAATAINGGNLQAGLSGTAGTVASFPSAATSGALVVAAVTNTSGNFNTTISNAAAVAQSQVVSVPDGGTSASNFLLSNSAAGQTIATGNLTLTAGYVIESAVNGLTALAGGAQAGTALTAQINRVTTVATAADSVQLPLAIVGKVVTVINAAAANAMAVFPQTGQIINALSANASISVAANKVITFYCAVAGTWNSQLTA